MSKKAAVTHWILFGVLLALGIFFLASKTLYADLEVKGKWQMDFLNNDYFPAQKELLHEEIVARNVGFETAFELAENGGFREKSPCGVVEGASLWNKKEQWCLPDIFTTISTHVKEKLTPRLPTIAFSDISTSGKILRGLGDKRVVESNVGKYEFDQHFAVDLGYSFEEYIQLFQEAKELVLACQSENDLKSCLDTKKLTHWNYGPCGNKKDQYLLGRKVLFCVVSPTKTHLPYGNDIIRSLKLVEYFFALDFTPIVAQPINDVMIIRKENLYEISFAAIPDAEGYVLYYTTWPQAKDNVPGYAKDIVAVMPTEFGYEWNSVKIPLSEGEKVVYSLNDPATGKELWLGVVSVKEGKESVIKQFVQS